MFKMSSSLVHAPLMLVKVLDILNIPLLASEEVHFRSSVVFLELKLTGNIRLLSAAAAPPPFRPGNPALCGSYPLVTPYYCRLGGLLCFVFIVSLYFFVLIV